MTLDAAGNGALTRERVRQLESRVREASSERPIPVVEEALNLLAECAPLTNHEASQLLIAEGLARGPFNPIGLVNAARLARIDERISCHSDCVFGIDGKHDAARIAVTARKIVTSNGAASVTAIVESLDDPLHDADTVRRILSLDAETRWLDEDEEWLFLPTGKNRAANLLRKMLAVAPSLRISEIREGFRRYRDREVVLPRNIISELCECFDWVRVDGERVAARPPLDFRLVLERTEETLVDIFRAEGPVLDRPTALDLGEQHGLDRTTTGLYLGWSPIIERIATNRYTLRGAEVPAGTLEAMHSSAPRRRVQRGYGWTSSGRLWVGYTLSQAVVDSGPIGVPSALRAELCGRTDIARYSLAAPNSDLGQLATDGDSIWGLARFLKKYAAEAGDALVLEFDLPAETVHALIGGQELLDPENRPEQVVEDSDAEAARPARISARASLSSGASGLEELTQPRPALFDPQLDLAAVRLPPAVSANETASSQRESQDLVDELFDEARSDAKFQVSHAGDELTESKGEPSSEQVAAEHGDIGQPCVVPGCPKPGKHKLGVRCRVWHEPSPIPGKSKTAALWAPDSDAFLCDEHALGGAYITLIYEPNKSGETAVKVIAAPYAEDRRTPIRHEPRAHTKPGEQADPTE
jgi:hypothetical protein